MFTQSFVLMNAAFRCLVYLVGTHECHIPFFSLFGVSTVMLVIVSFNRELNLKQVFIEMCRKEPNKNKGFNFKCRYLQRGIPGCRIIPNCQVWVFSVGRWVFKVWCSVLGFTSGFILKNFKHDCRFI